MLSVKMLSWSNVWCKLLKLLHQKDESSDLTAVLFGFVLHWSSSRFFCNGWCMSHIHLSSTSDGKLLQCNIQLDHKGIRKCYMNLCDVDCGEKQWWCSNDKPYRYYNKAVTLLKHTSETYIFYYKCINCCDIVLMIYSMYFSVGRWCSQKTSQVRIQSIAFLFAWKGSNHQ